MAELIENIVWGLPAAGILTWAGIYFSFKGNFFQFRYIKSIIIAPFKTEKEGDGPSGFATLAAALGGTLGTGNIAGVAVALSVGGPGALFWMCAGSLWGMATKFYEVYFAKKCNGPMGYMEKAYKRRLLPSIFCVICILGALFGTGCAAQGAVFTETASENLGLPLWLCGIICASWAAYSVSGGLKKTASVMAVVTPAICVLYLGVCFVVIWTFKENLPFAFKSILESAFGFDVKGLAGAYIAFSTGLRRGVFSNEAGLATSPIIHARASSNAVSQALCGCFEVFFDTIVCAGLTGIAILCTKSPTVLEAFCSVWGVYGEAVYAFSMCFFALSSIPCWYHYGRICLEYLGLSKRAGKIYFALFILSAALSAFQTPASALWRADILNGLMAAINLPALIMISRIVKPPKLCYNKQLVGDKLKKLRNSISNNKVVKITAWVSLVIFPLFLILGAELLQHEQKQYVISLVSERPLSVLFGYLPLLMLFAALCLILRRPAVASFLLGFFILIMSIVSKMKLDIVGEYLYPWDFLMLKNGGEFKKFDIKFDLTIYMIIILSTWLLWCAFIAISKIKIRLNIFLSLILSICVISCLGIYIFNEPFRIRNYPEMGVKVTDVTNQRENYEKHGFVSAFVLNTGNSAMVRSKNYSPEEVRKVLNRYETKNKSFGVKPDIVVILSEAFWDIRLLPGNTFSKNPLPNFDKISSEQITGDFVVPTHGGGTVRTEFEILTGISYDNFQTGIVPYSGSVLENTWSYPNHLKSLGYKTSAVHTYTKTFYNRDTAFPLIGIDSFIGQEDMVKPPYKGPYISDDYFADMIISELNVAQDEGVPAFIFGISMGNHGLYENKYKASELDFKVENSKLNAEELNIVQHFSQGVYDADKMLGKLYDFIKTRNRPTAILYFGDHQPSIGYDFSAYKQSGFLPAGKTGIPAEYMEKMLTCQYAILTNYNTGKRYEYKNESVSGYLLTNLFLDYLNVPKNSYMAFLSEYARHVPKNIPSRGIVSEDADKSVAKQFFNDHSLLSYDILHGRYGDMTVKFK